MRLPGMAKGQRTEAEQHCSSGRANVLGAILHMPYPLTARCDHAAHKQFLRVAACSWLSKAYGMATQKHKQFSQGNKKGAALICRAFEKPRRVSIRLLFPVAIRVTRHRAFNAVPRIA